MRPGVLIVVIVLLGGLGLVTARENACPAFAEFALERTNQVCEATGRNQACYGHVRLDAEPQADAADFHFSQIGDIAPVNAIHSLRLSAFDPNNSLWGIALMRLQANVPDTIPGQNVTFLMFGDVAVTSAVSKNPVLMDVSPRADITVSSYPVSAAPALGMLRRETVVVADGRLADSSWLRIEMPLGVQSVGWIRNTGLMSDGSVGDLEVLDPSDAQPRYRPMQAFYLTTANGTPVCNQIPTAGVLIQSPKAAGKINLLVNNVEVRIGSTVMFQAQPDGDMTITTLEGSALVKVGDFPIQQVVSGMRVRVPLDHNLQPTGPPSRPEPYNDANGRRLAINYTNAVPEIKLQPTEENPTQLISAPVAPRSDNVVVPPRRSTPISTPDTSGISTETATQTPSITPILLTVTETATYLPTWLPSPTQIPTTVPTLTYTSVPTDTPTLPPTDVPTEPPTSIPTDVPTSAPTLEPTQQPTDAPTAAPTQPPSATNPPPAPTGTPGNDPPPEPTATPTHHHHHSQSDGEAGG